jgi:hypothetical protein
MVGAYTLSEGFGRSNQRLKANALQELPGFRFLEIRRDLRTQPPDERRG